MKKFLMYSATLLASAAVLAFTDAKVWKIKDTYNIAFSNTSVSGIFKKFSGTIDFDEANLTSSKFNVSIEVASINTGNGLQNKHAKEAEWFDAAKYPYIKYTSSKIEKSGTSYKVSGQLEIKGIKKDVSFPFTFKKAGNSGTFNGEFSINRSDFNIGQKGGEVAEAIKINISIPVTQ
jgi:polyisoprenoid-binding protein YceI